MFLIVLKWLSDLVESGVANPEAGLVELRCALTPMPRRSGLDFFQRERRLKQLRIAGALREGSGFGDRQVQQMRTPLPK